jgi:uncharacterized ferritin-like protein (DUF455 family)
MSGDGRNLFHAAADCFRADDATTKVSLTRHTAAAWDRGELQLDATEAPASYGRPGMPARLVLVAPRDVPKRPLGGSRGAAAFVHAIAHIEFNAINLAWDCVLRFRDLPRQYYADWVSVARDEAEHFALLAARLAELGCEYGDFPAHDGLWQMAEKTRNDAAARMALVPRYLEARGLDVAPGMITRLERSGDTATAAIVRRILREEVAHVAAGTRWFRFLCAERGVDSEREFIRLLRTHGAGRAAGPLNDEARELAGFTPAELRALKPVSTD